MELAERAANGTKVKLWGVSSLYLLIGLEG